MNTAEQFYVRLLANYSAAGLISPDWIIHFPYLASSQYSTVYPYDTSSPPIHSFNTCNNTHHNPNNIRDNSNNNNDNGNDAIVLMEDEVSCEPSDVIRLRTFYSSLSEHISQFADSHKVPDLKKYHKSPSWFCRELKRIFIWSRLIKAPITLANSKDHYDLLPPPFFTSFSGEHLWKHKLECTGKTKQVYSFNISGNHIHITNSNPSPGILAEYKVGDYHLNLQTRRIFGPYRNQPHQRGFYPSSFTDLHLAPTATPDDPTSVSMIEDHTVGSGQALDTALKTIFLTQNSTNTPYSQSFHCTDTAFMLTIWCSPCDPNNDVLQNYSITYGDLYFNTHSNTMFGPFLGISNHTILQLFSSSAYRKATDISYKNTRVKKPAQASCTESVIDQFATYFANCTVSNDQRSFQHRCLEALQRNLSRGMQQHESESALCAIPGLPHHSLHRLCHSDLPITQFPAFALQLIHDEEVATTHQQTSQSSTSSPPSSVAQVIPINRMPSIQSSSCDWKQLSSLSLDNQHDWLWDPFLSHDDISTFNLVIRDSIDADFWIVSPLLRFIRVGGSVITQNNHNYTDMKCMMNLVDKVLKNSRDYQPTTVSPMFSPAQVNSATSSSMPSPSLRNRRLLQPTLEGPSRRNPNLVLLNTGMNNGVYVNMVQHLPPVSTHTVQRMMYHQYKSHGLGLSNVPMKNLLDGSTALALHRSHASEQSPILTPPLSRAFRSHPTTAASSPTASQVVRNSKYTQPVRALCVSFGSVRYAIVLFDCESGEWILVLLWPFAPHQQFDPTLITSYESLHAWVCPTVFDFVTLWQYIACLWQSEEPNIHKINVFSLCTVRR